MRYGLIAAVVMAMLAALPCTADDGAADDDPFYADRFLIPNDSDFLERHQERDEEPGATAGLSQLRRKDSNPYGRVASAIFDGVVVRLPAAGSLVLGSAAFALSAPVAAPTGMLGESLDVFVRGPYRFAITRPLGTFSD